MIILEDNGTNKYFEGEFDIDIELKNGNNYITFFPLMEENNLIASNYIISKYFYYYKYEQEKESKISNGLITFLSIIGIIFISIIIYKLFYNQKKSSSIQ